MSPPNTNPEYGESFVLFQQLFKISLQFCFSIKMSSSYRFLKSFSMRVMVHRKFCSRFDSQPMYADT